MKFLKPLLLGVVVVLITTGCAQKTSIKAIKAAKVTDPSIKNIGVLPFKNDNIAQSSSLDSEISNVTISDKKYFNLVDRNNLQRVLGEKRLNDSGLVRVIKRSKDKGLSQIETLVTGSVNVNDVATSKYLESRTDYSRCVRYARTKKGRSYCAAYRKYNVNCEAKTYSVNTKVKLIKVSDASTMFTNNYSASSKKTKCVDQNRVLPTKRDENTRLAAQISNQIIKDIAPSYVYFTVTLLDDPDTDYNKGQKAMLKTSLALIKNKRIKKADSVLKRLVKSTKNNSFVALYNYGVTQEALGNVEKAISLYKRAEDVSIMTEGPQEEISVAIRRAEANLKELQKAQKQL